jgi:hypothetical protein
MTFEVVEDWEERTASTVTQVKIYETDDPKYPSGWRYALHYGYRDGRGVVRRYDNENETSGRHERHTPDGVTEIEFPGMLELRDRFIDEIESMEDETDVNE